MESEIKNAKIESTMLGKEDHGIMSCMIGLNYGGSGQGFGGYCFDTPSGKHDYKRIGSAYGMEFICRLLDTLEVESWEKLIGTHCRVDASFCKVHGIGHILKNKWFYPEKDLADFVEKAKEV